MTEKQFQRQVIQLAKLLGWSVYHTFLSRRSQPGYPDLTLWKRGRGVIFADLKSATGVLRPDQTTTIASMKAAGLVVYVWRPLDLQVIAEILGE